MEEFVERYPEAMEDLLIEDLDEFWEDHAEDTIFVIPGDVTLTEDDIAQLPGGYPKIVVEGCLRVAVNPTYLLYVKGDLFCDSLSLDVVTLLVVGGQAFVKNYVSLNAEDDEAMQSAPTLRVTTPLLFSWFFNIDRLTLSPETIIFILGCEDYCDQLALPNLKFTWHRAVNVLKPEFTIYVGDNYHDYACWNLEKIAVALENGESIFIDGFSVKAMEYQAFANMLIFTEDLRAAYLTYKKVACLFPGYYGGWFGMGSSLKDANAFAQSVPFFQEAVKRFPTDQTGLVNYAADYGARAAIRCRQFETAVLFATQSLKHNRSEEEKSRVDAFCFRAEALSRLNRIPEATDDVDAALALDKNDSTANWLKGLLLHRKGMTTEAEKYRQLAVESDEDFDESYDEADWTDFLDDEPATVDWDNVDIANYEPPAKDEAFWQAYLSEKDAMHIKIVPPVLRTNAICMAIVAREAAEEYCSGHMPAAAYFPKAVFTRELAVALVTLSLRYLQYVPINFVDKTLFMLGPIKKQNMFDFNNVPEDIVDADICLHAARCGAKLESLPPAWINKEICFVCVEYDASALKHVPAALHTDELYFAAMMTTGDKYRFEEYIPRRYKTPEMLARAIAYNKRNLHSILGNLFDAKLLVLAEQLYGDDEDWTEILAQHGCATANEKGWSGVAAETCWCAFWDEAFILRHIKIKEGSHIHPFDILSSCYSQVIAEACFERDKIHLDKIPSRWITSEMCTTFIGKYPDMLDHVAMRTEAICARAVKAKPTVCHRA